MRAADMSRIQVSGCNARTAAGCAPEGTGAGGVPQGWFEMTDFGARNGGQASARETPPAQRAGSGNRFAAAMKLLAERVCKAMRTGVTDIAALAGRIMSDDSRRARPQGPSPARAQGRASASTAAAKAGLAHAPGAPRQSRLLNLMEDPRNTKGVGEAIALLNLASGNGRPVILHGMSYQQLQAFTHAAARFPGRRLSGAARKVLATNGHNRLVEALRATLDRHPALRNRGRKLSDPRDLRAVEKMKEMVRNAPTEWRSDLALKTAFLPLPGGARTKSSAIPPSSGASPKTPPQTAAQAA